MEAGKSLGRLLLDTVGFTLVTYPIYSIASSFFDPSKNIMDEIKDPSTAIKVAGFGLGYFIYYGVREFVRRRREY